MGALAAGAVRMRCGIQTDRRQVIHIETSLEGNCLQIHRERPACAHH